MIKLKSLTKPINRESAQQNQASYYDEKEQVSIINMERKALALSTKI